MPSHAASSIGAGARAGPSCGGRSMTTNQERGDTDHVRKTRRQRRASNAIRSRATARPGAQPRHRLYRSGARQIRPARLSAAACAHPGRAGGARARAPAPADRPAGEIRRAQRAARPQRVAVLSRAVRQHRRNAAAGLHPDRRTGVPEIRPHLSAAARPVHRRQRPRAHRAVAAQLALPGRHHRRHRRRAHSRPGRSGRQRHGHSGRQAVALHRVRRRAPATVPAGHHRRRHQQRGDARGPVLRRAAPAPPHRRGLRRTDRRIHHRGIRRCFRAW